MIRQMSDEELVYSIALFSQECASLRCGIDGHLHRRRLEHTSSLEEARPSEEEIKATIDGVFFIHDQMPTEVVLEHAQKRIELYNSMLYPYRDNPSCHDALMLKLLRERFFGWGRKREYFKLKSYNTCPRD